MARQASRFREAREYLGVSQEQVSAALKWDVDRIMQIEDGGTKVTGLEVRRLARLYRRPVAWFSGVSDFQPSPDLLRKVEHLCDGDREAILDFAEWLQGAGPAPQIPPALLNLNKESP